MTQIEISYTIADKVYKKKLSCHDQDRGLATKTMIDRISESSGAIIKSIFFKHIEEVSK